jgi:ankyrin repeat protein
MEMVKLLLDNQANESVLNVDGKSPLYHAVGRRHIEMVILLLHHGAKVGFHHESTSALYVAHSRYNKSADGSNLRKRYAEIVALLEDWKHAGNE